MLSNHSPCLRHPAMLAAVDHWALWRRRHLRSHRHAQSAGHNRRHRRGATGRIGLESNRPVPMRRIWCCRCHRPAGGHTGPESIRPDLIGPVMIRPALIGTESTRPGLIELKSSRPVSMRRRCRCRCRRPTGDGWAPLRQRRPKATAWLPHLHPLRRPLQALGPHGGAEWPPPPRIQIMSKPCG